MEHAWCRQLVQQSDLRESPSSNCSWAASAEWAFSASRTASLCCPSSSSSSSSPPICYSPLLHRSSRRHKDRTPEKWRFEIQRIYFEKWKFVAHSSDLVYSKENSAIVQMVYENEQNGPSISQKRNFQQKTENCRRNYLRHKLVVILVKYRKLVMRISGC